MIALSAALFTGTALAHQGVTGPTKLRMDLMKDIGKATKALGSMAKSGVFNRSELVELAGAITRHGERIEQVFTERHMHPKTEALPVIWDDWDRFSTLGRDMVSAARTIKIRAMNPDAEAAWLRGAIRDLGATCKACHRDFRKD